MIALFNSVIQFFGLLGVFKYIMDQSSVNAVHHMLAALHDITKSGGPASITAADRQKLVTDVSARMWDRVVGPPDSSPCAPIWIVKKAVPEGLRDICGYAAYPFACAYNKVSGRDKLIEGSARERARHLAVQGMWCFLIPATLAMLSACLLVREVEFVEVASDRDYYSDTPEQSSRIVKRIMLGGGRLSFSIPYNPLLMVTAQLFVGITVFHLVSLIIVTLAYSPGNTPPASPR